MNELKKESQKEKKGKGMINLKRYYVVSDSDENYKPLIKMTEVTELRIFRILFYKSEKVMNQPIKNR